jgi:hypothetical protein
LADVFLPTLKDELSQGDVVELCPVGALPSIRVVRTWGDAQPEAKAFVYPYPLPLNTRRPPTPPLFKKRDGAGDDVIFEASLLRCVIVSNDCVAIDKAGSQARSLGLTNKARNIPWHVVPLRDWPEESRVVQLEDGHAMPLGDLIEAGRIHRYLSFPRFVSGKGEEVLPRSYADFRFLTPLKPELFENVTRLASMTDFGLARLWAKAYTYFSGRAIPEKLRCPHCGEASALEELGEWTE